MDLHDAVTWLDVIILLAVFLVAELAYAVWKARGRFTELVDLDDDVTPPSSSLAPAPADSLTPPPHRGDD